MKIDVQGRKEERRREERDATTGLFSRRNIAPASECVRNRADCNSVEMNGIKKEKKTESHRRRAELTWRYCPRSGYVACTL